LIYLQDIDANLNKEAIAYEQVMQADDLWHIRVASVDMISVTVYNQNAFIGKERGLMLNPQQQIPGYLGVGNGEIVFRRVQGLKTKSGLHKEQNIINYY
jgi:hypothetical protein